MLKLLIRYGTFILGSYYIFRKLLNINENFKADYVILSLEGICLSVTAYFLPEDMQHITYPLLIFALFLYFAVVTRERKNTVFVATTLSVAITLALYTFSFLLDGIIYGALGYYLSIPITNTYVIISSIPTAVFFLFLCRFTFRIPRFKNGMPFLRKQIIANMGFFISFFIIFIYMVFILFISTNSPVTFQTLIILAFSIFSAGILLIFWWKSQLHTTYLSALKRQNYHLLLEQTAACEKTMIELQQETAQLSCTLETNYTSLEKTRHLTKEFLSVLPCSDEVKTYTIKKLQNCLEEEMEQRNQFLLSCSQNGSKFISTGMFSLDNLLSYIQQRCCLEGISFAFTCSEKCSGLTDILEEKELSTLLADLLDNALIAMKYNQGKQLFLWIRKKEGIYCMDIYDSGIDFSIETLISLGKSPCTTHKEQGGSGIGLMNTYALLQQCGGSLWIDETIKQQGMYTKMVSVHFDHKGEYHLKTKRTGTQLQQLLLRRDLIVE